MDALYQFVRSKPIAEILASPLLATLWISMACNELGIDIKDARDAMATGDMSILERALNKVVNLNPNDYWETFKQDALDQADSIIGGEA